MTEADENTAPRIAKLSHKSMFVSIEITNLSLVVCRAAQDFGNRMRLAEKLQ